MRMLKILRPRGSDILALPCYMVGYTMLFFVHWILPVAIVIIFIGFIIQQGRP